MGFFEKKPWLESGNYITTKKYIEYVLETNPRETVATQDDYGRFPGSRKKMTCAHLQIIIKEVIKAHNKFGETIPSYNERPLKMLLKKFRSLGGTEPSRDEWEYLSKVIDEVEPWVDL